MAFTYTKVNFLNNESYNEIKHSQALASGWPNFVVEGFDYDDAAMTITNGRAMNGGLPVILGREGETQEITNNGTDVYVVLKTVLQGVSSINTIEMRATKVTINEDTLKEFPLYRIDPTTGVMLEDYRHSTFIKDVYFEDLGDDTFRIVINGTWSPPFNVSVLQSSWSKSDADNRFERALNINNNYVNEDLAGLNMAQIVNLFSTAMDVSMTSDLGANTVVASCSSSDFSNLHLALNNLLSSFYGVTSDGILTFRYEAIYGKSTGGGQTLAVTVNNGATFQFQYDNYGENYLTDDLEAFQATKIYYGAIDVDYLNIRSSDNFLIRGYVDTPTVTSGVDFMNIDYSNGVNLFNISRNESSTLTGRQLRIYLRNRADGIIQQGLEINSGDTSGVVHRADGVNKRLAYASELTRALKLQRSGLIIDIEELQAKEAAPARATAIAKTLSAKEALLQEVEEELKTLEANMEEAKQNGEQQPNVTNESED